MLKISVKIRSLTTQDNLAVLLSKPHLEAKTVRFYGKTHKEKGQYMDFFKIPAGQLPNLVKDLGLEISFANNDVRLISSGGAKVIKPRAMKIGKEEWWVFGLEMGNFPTIATKLRELKYVKKAL